jgi:hypothetical protein
MASEDVHMSTAEQADPQDNPDPEEEEYDEVCEESQPASEANEPKATTSRRKKKEKKHSQKVQKAQVNKVQKLPKLKKFKDLRWRDMPGRMFHMLSPDNKRAWEKAYNLYNSRDSEGIMRCSYPMKFLASISFARGCLLPGLTAEGAWPVWLFHLYDAMHQCVQFAFSVRLSARSFIVPHLSSALEKLDKLRESTDLPQEVLDTLKETASLIDQVAYETNRMSTGEYFAGCAHVDCYLPEADD